MAIEIQVGGKTFGTKVLICLMERYSRKIIEAQLNEYDKKFNVCEPTPFGLRFTKGEVIFVIPYHTLVFWKVK